MHERAQAQVGNKLLGSVYGPGYTMHCNLKLFDCLLRLPHSATGSLCCRAGSEKASWTGSAVSFTVKLNTEDLHKNRETPSAFICQLGVVDSRLPLNLTAQKGAWNTRPRSCGEQVFTCAYIRASHSILLILLRSFMNGVLVGLDVGHYPRPPFHQR